MNAVYELEECKVSSLILAQIKLEFDSETKSYNWALFAQVPPPRMLVTSQS